VTVALSQRLTAHMEAQMGNGKEAAHFGVPWEKTYGYAQAVRVGNTTYVAGQLSHVTAPMCQRRLQLRPQPRTYCADSGFTV